MHQLPQAQNTSRSHRSKSKHTRTAVKHRMMGPESSAAASRQADMLRKFTPQALHPLPGVPLPAGEVL